MKLASYHKKGENIRYMGDKRKRLVVEQGYDSKNAAHCIRLLRMGSELLATGEMQVYRTSDGDELLEIKRGKWPLDRVKKHAQELLSKIQVARDQSTLPAQPDRDRAEELPIALLRREVR